MPDAVPAPGHNLVHYNLGTSAVYALTPDWHFRLEWVGIWEEVPRDAGGSEDEFGSLISPGVCTAFNFANESQLVLGLAAPLGLTSSAPDYGVFFSFEHGFGSKR